MTVAFETATATGNRELHRKYMIDARFAAAIFVPVHVAEWRPAEFRSVAGEGGVLRSSIWPEADDIGAMIQAGRPLQTISVPGQQKVQIEGELQDP